MASNLTAIDTNGALATGLTTAFTATINYADSMKGATMNIVKDFQEANMKRKSLAYVFLAAAIFFASCATPFKQVKNPNIPYERSNYSILPPQEQGWTYVDRAGADGHKLMFGKQADSKTHTFIAMIEDVRSNATFTNSKEFILFIKKLQEMNTDPRRYRTLDEKMTLDDRFGSFCVFYYRKAEDHGAQQWGSLEFLIMEGYGYTFIHPNHNNLLIDVSYSERGSSNEIDPGKITENAQNFFNGLKMK